MQVTIDPSLDTDETLRSAVTDRAGLLEGIFNGTATAEWRKGSDWSGKLAVQLRLRDSSGARAGADLLPFEFKNVVQLEERFRDLRDALQKVREWRSAVTNLFATIRPWCEALPGAPTVTEMPTRVVEATSGEYEIVQLVVTRGRAVMTIRPDAAWVVGWEGLVSMKGPGDQCMLYYSRANDAWYHIPNYLPYRELPLTEALFRELAEGALDD